MHLPPPFITVDDITVRLRDRWLLQGSSWRINTGEQWAVTGPNGAGKTTLAKAIAGLLPVVQGKIHYHTFDGILPVDAIAYVASDARRDSGAGKVSWTTGEDSPVGSETLPPSVS
jgi:ABC-type Mn2+/Zn2+ transport system ATPase subunit